MIYAVEHGGQTTFIQAKPHRAHYVAQQVAGYRDEEGPLPQSRVLVVQRVPNEYTLTPVGRISEIRAASRAKRRLAERRRIFESLAEGGES
jgi:hypothetical protein